MRRRKKQRLADTQRPPPALRATSPRIGGRTTVALAGRLGSRRDEKQRLADTRRSENPGLAFPANPKRPERATVIRPPWGKMSRSDRRGASRWRGATRKPQKATPRRSATPQKATPR